jgi:CBS domain containing-hemolysin-like protein
VHPEATIEQLVELTRRSGFDRYPVVDSAGKIVGLVNVFDLLVDRPTASTIRHYVRRILTVRSHEQASIVLRRLRASPYSLAAVVDADGNPTGIVSAEDLLNPLVRVDR